MTAGSICFPEHDAEKEERTREWSLGTRFGALNNCIAAVDGTHVPFWGRDHTFVPSRWRNRKGFTSVNIQVVCDARRRILALFVGAEGSANDQQIYNWSMLKDKVPVGLYVLGDAGYALKKV